MPFLQPSIEGLISPTQDPWDWTVDEVIFALTDPQSSLLQSNSTLKMPAAGDFAGKLREVDVTGLALLCEMKENDMRDELGIKSMGHRASIKHLIRLLREVSAQYQKEIVAKGRASSVSMSSHVGTSSLASPQHVEPGVNPIFFRTWRSPTASTGEYQGRPSIDGVLGPLLELQESWRCGTPAEAPSLPPPIRQNVQSLGGEEGLAIESMVATGGQIEACNKDNHHDAPGMISDGILDTDDAIFHSGQRIRQGETILIDEGGKQRRRLVLSAVDVPCTAAPLGAQRTGLGEPLSLLSTVQMDSNDDHRAHPMLEPGFRSPDLPDDEPLTENFTLDMPTEADPAVANPQQQIAEPGALLIDKDGRKRMRPILLTQPGLDPEQSCSGQFEVGNAAHKVAPPAQSVSDIEASLPVKQWTYGRKATRNNDQIYLGLEPCPVEDLFYGDSPLETKLDGEDDSDPSNSTDNFAFALSDSSSTGRCIYVNSRMKYFLQSQIIQLRRGKRGYTGRVPYPSRIGRKHYPLSMTIFSRSPDRVSALRSNRSKWLEDDFARAPRLPGETSDVFNVADPVLAQDDGDDPSWKSLEKWKYMDGHDNVLPLYGESGSEGEYELDTWKEMELERGELARPVGKSRSLRLASEQVDEAIESATKQIVEDWNLKRKPRLQLKAWRLWTRSRWERDTQAQIDRFAEEIKRVNARLVNLRKEIAAEEWSKPSQIHQQCNILQPSIFELEDDKWKVATLMLRTMPKKPPPTIRKARPDKAEVIDGALNDDEENLVTDADDSDASEGSLDDFIVDDPVEADDYQPATVDDDLTMADIEDSLESDTLVSGKAHSTLDMPAVVPKTEPSTHSTREQELEAHRTTSTQPAIVDLTLDSDPGEPAQPLKQPESSFAIKTPPLYSSENESDVFQRSRSQKKVFKVFPVPDPVRVINLETDSADSAANDKVSQAKKVLPPLSDFNGIGAMDPSELVERQDRKRLLIWMVAHAPIARRSGASRYLAKVSAERSRSEVTLGLKKIREYKLAIRGLDKEMSDAVLSIATWLICWTIPVKADSSGLNTAHIDFTLRTLADEDNYESFYDFLLECLSCYQTAPVTLGYSTPKKRRQKILREDSDDALHSTPVRKRIYVVHESQETLDKRQAAQDRMRGDEERRRREELKSRFKALSADDSGASQVIVNPGKLEDQDFIYLNARFGNGAYVKPHQAEGLQFLWREITAEPDDPQGCLLAQTMGLGKTMQVIALVVTLSEAGQSSCKNIRRQVPRPLRQPRTLVLCPPALLENWWDEFLIWVPQHSSESVGGLRKVSVSLKPVDRLAVIQDWSDKGGVLLIGYDTFKNMIYNPLRMSKKNTVSKATLDDDQHERVKRALLQRANLVVADEAHSFKGKSSKLNSAMNQIRSKSRVALTGSPLSNNLEEYYTIIDWIAPNYLGTYPEFKATYEEPIREGLYQDSTESQYRESRKRLKALELEMEPKVHRANISVLNDTLRGKLEFVVRVPLTKLQEELYRLCVESMREAITGREPGKASLWSWLGVLQLLCNHPECFLKQMLIIEANLADRSKAEAPVKKKPADPDTIDEGLLGSDEDAALLAEPRASTAFTRIINESGSIYRDLEGPLEALSLSNKMQLLIKILEFANAAHDKVLVFSHRIATLDYVEARLKSDRKDFERIDGTIAAQRRQQITKSFNEGKVNICLISTRAGGTGLNLYGANRVVILDEHFNPMWELQAIGRAYRIGQRKPVYVYRLTAGGTFEQEIQNQALFKEQLATRVVDKKNPNRSALKGAGQYLFPPKTLEPENLSKFYGKDPCVLDRLLADSTHNRIISITPSETFHIEDGVELTPAERKEAELMQKAEQLRRRDPQAYYKMEADKRARQNQSVKQHTAIPPSTLRATASGIPSTQPVRGNHQYSTSAMDLPPSTAPTSAASMGGLPFPNMSYLDIPNSLTASYGVNLAPTLLPTESVPEPTLRQSQSPPLTGQLERLNDGSTLEQLRSSTMATGTNSNSTRTLGANGADSEEGSLKKAGKTAELPGGRLFHTLEPEPSDVSDASKFAETELSVSIPSQRNHQGDNRWEQSPVNRRVSSDRTTRKHNLIAEERSRTKKVKSAPAITPNFKVNGDMERNFTNFLERDRARTDQLKKFGVKNPK